MVGLLLSDIRTQYGVEWKFFESCGPIHNYHSMLLGINGPNASSSWSRTLMTDGQPKHYTVKCRLFLGMVRQNYCSHNKTRIPHDIFERHCLLDKSVHGTGWLTPKNSRYGSQSVAPTMQHPTTQIETKHDNKNKNSSIT